MRSQKFPEESVKELIKRVQAFRLREIVLGEEYVTCYECGPNIPCIFYPKAWIAVNDQQVEYIGKLYKTRQVGTYCSISPDEVHTLSQLNRLYKTGERVLYPLGNRSSRCYITTGITIRTSRYNAADLSIRYICLPSEPSKMSLISRSKKDMITRLIVPPV